MIKENSYKARKKLYNDNVTAKVLGYESDNKIFVVESLTGKNKDLFHKRIGLNEKRDTSYLDIIRKYLY